MGETGQCFVFCTSDLGKLSDSLQFHSGHETEAGSPLSSPRRPFGLPSTLPASDRSLNAIDKKEKNDRRRLSPKPSKRTRKMSLFSQFHFINARSDDKHGKSKKISAPTISSLVPCSTLPLGYSDDILPDLSSDSSTSSVQSIQSSSSLPVQLTVETPSYFKRKKSTGNCPTSNVTTSEKETATVRDMILETLTLQFENVTEYKREICDKLGKNVSELVRRRVEIMKEGSGQQCKVVTLVYVGAVRDNGIDVTTQALLDTYKDLFTAASYRNGHVFAMAAAMVISLD